MFKVLSRDTRCITYCPYLVLDCKDKAGMFINNAGEYNGELFLSAIYRNFYLKPRKDYSDAGEFNTEEEALNFIRLNLLLEDDSC